MFSNRKLVLFTITLVTLTIAAYVIFVVIPAQLARKSYEGAKAIGRDIREIFQFTPEVTVNNVVILEQQTPVLELATVSQTFRHEYEWTNTWLGSTKKIKITGTLDAKAGFDLREKFSVHIDDEKAVVTLSQPRLLSLEQKGDIAFSDEQGMWNWVKPEDRTAAINAFNADARRYAAEAPFILQAQEDIEDQLREIFMAHGKQMEIRYTDRPVERLDFPGQIRNP
ncbi:MAG TPA: DUF4230 domain-containing protein [Ohtaekwangia sp.]|nr:DUF4230 domain-containing protein [Ohtaekwangia sp.]